MRPVWQSDARRTRAARVQVDEVDTIAGFPGDCAREAAGWRAVRDRNATAARPWRDAKRQARDPDAAAMRAFRSALQPFRTPSHHRCGTLASRARARRGRIGRERIGKARCMKREHMSPGAVERRTGKPLAQAMRARPRHARRARGASDAAGFEQRRQKDALPCRGPMGAAGHDRRGGGRRRGIARNGVLFHPTGWSRPIPTLRAEGSCVGNCWNPV